MQSESLALLYLHIGRALVESNVYDSVYKMTSRVCAVRGVLNTTGPGTYPADILAHPFPNPTTLVFGLHADVRGFFRTLET